MFSNVKVSSPTSYLQPFILLWSQILVHAIT
jgi:hypothetical protein